MTEASPENIRPVNRTDLPALKSIIDATEMFPSEMLEEMMEPYFSPENDSEYWITYFETDVPLAIAYFAPERMTNGTYNLYLIATDPRQQSKELEQSYSDMWKICSNKKDNESCW